MASEVTTWVHPQLLESDAMEQYHEAFVSHPARLLVLRSFLPAEQADSLHTFLTENAEYETKYGLYSVADVGVDHDTWLAAPEEDRFFQFSQLKRNPPRGPR